jgi:hypothetical protein
MICMALFSVVPDGTFNLRLRLSYPGLAFRFAEEKI